MLYFLHSLKCLLHKHGHGCASVSLAPEISANGWGGVGWMEKVGWATDGAVTISAFTGKWWTKLRRRRRLKMLSEPGPLEHISRTSRTGPDPQSSGTSHSKSTGRSVLDVAGAGDEWGEQPGVQMHTEAACN